MMWGENASPVKIAAELGISQCTVYTELKLDVENASADDVQHAFIAVTCAPGGETEPEGEENR